MERTFTPGWVPMALLLAGCTSPPACPPEMAAITHPDGQIHYCIDRWEVQVVGPTGEAAGAHDLEGDPSRLATRSMPGVRPSGASFNQARMFCENTPLRHPSGKVVGHKHLATSSEWEDAGDGSLGLGGRRFPYGDQVALEACATLNQHGQPSWDDIQPTGSLPNCKSQAGVYDQIGNMWEWTDPQLTYDLSRWLKVVRGRGIQVDITADGHLIVPPEHLSQLSIWIPSVKGHTPQVDEQGRLTAIAHRSQDHRGLLYLNTAHTNEQIPDPRDSQLPIELDINLNELTPMSATVVVLKVSTGSIPVVDKRGCAFYAGSPEGCTLQASAFNHRETFTGTIGFRCASPPISP